MPGTISRRKLLRSGGQAIVAGGAAAVCAGSALPAVASSRPKVKGVDYYQKLGVTTFINAAGTYTTLTASTMPDEVQAAVALAALHPVNLIELHEAAGQYLAKRLRCEGALVTAGAASALTLGTAACVTAGNDADILSIPTDMNSLKNEVIVQKSHRYDYDHAVRNCGVRFVEVETLEQYEQAFNERTVMTHFFNAGEEHISREDWVRVAHKHGVPCFNDAAADVPPISNLWNYTQMGFDLVTFSGGKGLRGPQCTGLLLGRKDLIEAAQKEQFAEFKYDWPRDESRQRGNCGPGGGRGLVSGPGRRRHGSRLPPAGGAHCRGAEEHPDGANSDIHSCGGESRSPSGDHL